MHIQIIFYFPPPKYLIFTKVMLNSHTDIYDYIKLTQTILPYSLYKKVLKHEHKINNSNRVLYLHALSKMAYAGCA